MTHPRIIGLTGSIGMGKSTVAEMFERHGVPVFDADAEVRKMQGPRGELIESIEAAFPGSTSDEGVRRDALGARVFGDPEALARLEAIVHPAVAAKRVEFLIEHGGAPMVVFDIPLLFEKGGHENVDTVVVVSAPARWQDVVHVRTAMCGDEAIEVWESMIALTASESWGRRPGGDVGGIMAPKPSVKLPPASAGSGGQEVARTFAKHKRKLRACYAKELNTMMAPQGTVDLRFRIGADGKPSDVRAEIGTYRGPKCYDCPPLRTGELLSCLRAAVETLSFAARTEPVDVTYSVEFIAKHVRGK